MFTRSHTTAICAALAMLSAAILAGCSTATRAHKNEPAQQASAIPVPNRIKLCWQTNAPPPAIASKPGYSQFAVTVTDSSGHSVTNLMKSAFFANVGPHPVPIVYFHAAKTPRPVAVAIIVDTSGSMGPKLPTVRDALDDFVDRLNACDEVELIAFSNRVFLLQPFTTDRKLVKSRFALFRAYGQTALFDSVAEGLRMLKKASYEDRSVLLITDGMDNASLTTRSQIVEKARAAGIPIYAIGIGNPNASDDRSIDIGPFTFGGSDMNRVDAKALKELANASDGRAFIVPEMKSDNGKAFKAAVASIGKLIGGGYYTIGVVLPPDATTPSVDVVNHSKATVRLRRERNPELRANPPPSASPPASHPQRS